jgi:hypothetical protein
MPTLSVPINADLISQIILRSNGRADVASMVEHSLETFLDRTRGDPDIWSEEHADQVAQEDEDGQIKEVGDPSRGYLWSGVFLPNGTSLRIEYKGEYYFADVRHQTITFRGETCSPSQFASRAAGNTSRNAWRDIWLQYPGTSGWVFADEARRKARAGR